jgi:arylsulfatase A-like enzyme
MPSYRRFLTGLTGALLAGVGAAFVDAARAAGGLPGWSLFAAEFGLFGPLAFVLGVAVGTARVLLLPTDFPNPTRTLAALREAESERRFELSSRSALLALAGLLALIVVARTALRTLASSEAVRPSGAGLALATLGVATLAVLVTFGGASLVTDAAPERSRSAARPLRAGALSLAAFALVFGVLVARGATSGAGDRLALFGVFKREELDLWPSALALTMVLVGLFLPALRAAWAFWGLLVVSLLSLGSVPHAASSAFDRKTSLVVERHAPLGKTLLALARRLTDRDHDGASALFGGGDCAEGDPRRNPAADDVPGNGIDEDCTGSDAVRLAPPGAAAPRSSAAARLERARLPEKPNVILITIDALRSELGYAGYSRNVSPRLDALAKQSAVFERAYSLASYTSKSLAPMLIGRYGSETHRGFLHFNRFTREDTFVSERLQKAGIRTVSVQGHWYFFKNYGFERGYDVIDTQATPADQPIEGDRTSNGDELSDRIIAELSDPKLESSQFFLWSHYLDPHGEYVAHDEFDFGHKGRERYDGEIAFVDHHLGRVLEALEHRPFASRTVVIVTSDHGEAFGEHDLYRHGFELWEELVRVPLLVYVPGAEPRRIPVRRSAIDIVPTILDIFGVAAPPSGDKGALRGQSLLGDVLGSPGSNEGARPIYIDMPAGPYNDERQALIDGSLKIVTSGGRPLGLFDLDKDPGEKRDLTDEKSLAQPMLEKTKAFRRSLEEVVEKPK